MERAGTPYRSGRLSTVDLLVLTSLDQILFIFEILFNLFTKQDALTRRSMVLTLLLQIVLPGSSIGAQLSIIIKQLNI
jgi:hypothetical protein